LIREICAGLEEEGVLFAVVTRNETNAETLAFNASSESLLGVGIGISGSSAAMQMKNFAVNSPIFRIDSTNLSDYRNLGTNAALAVKGGMFV